MDEGVRLAQILDVNLSSPDGSAEIGIPHGGEMILEVSYRVNSDLDTLTVAMYVRDERNLEIMGTNTRIEECDIIAPRSGDIGMLTFRFVNLLRTGEYSIAIRLAADVSGQHVFPEFRENALTYRSLAGQRWAILSPQVRIIHHVVDQ